MGWHPVIHTQGPQKKPSQSCHLEAILQDSQPREGNHSIHEVCGEVCGQSQARQPTPGTPQDWKLRQVDQFQARPALQSEFEAHQKKKGWEKEKQGWVAGSPPGKVSGTAGTARWQAEVRATKVSTCKYLRPQLVVYV